MLFGNRWFPASLKFKPNYHQGNQTSLWVRQFQQHMYDCPKTWAKATSRSVRVCLWHRMFSLSLVHYFVSGKCMRIFNTKESNFGMGLVSGIERRNRDCQKTSGRWWAWNTFNEKNTIENGNLTAYVFSWQTVFPETSQNSLLKKTLTAFIPFPGSLSRWRWQQSV